MLSKTELDTIAQLQFFATDVVQGMAIGHHLSPHRGTSMQFKEHRAYVAGDEIRTLDWKLFGKTDRLYTRQFEDESNLRCMLMVDQSGSMAYGNGPAGSKFQFAIRLAACLAALLLKQQDAVGLATLSSSGADVLPSLSRPNYLKTIIRSLALASPSTPSDGNTIESICDSIPKVSSSLKTCDVVFLISDCFEPIDNLVEALAQFKHRRRQVMVLQILDRDELEFPFNQRLRFNNLENSQTREINATAFRNKYLERMSRFQASLGERLSESQIERLVFATDLSHQQVLSEIVGHQVKRR